jgi:hypothetical protein
MTGFDHACDGFIGERSRRFNFTEQPLGDSEVGPRHRTNIRAEVEPGLMIALGIVNAQRFSQIRFRLGEIALPETRGSQ